jgi:starvation-inducible DNA-binding protein
MITTTKSIHTVADTVRQMMREQSAIQLKEDASVALVGQMKKILADGYAIYFKAHTFHWNVEGSNFPQYHAFLDTVYTQLFEKLDPIAEQIRALKTYAPTSLKDLLAMSSITEATIVPSPPEMMNQLLEDNLKVINSLTIGYKLAEQAQEVGLSNFLQDLIDKHKKLGWMLQSTVKGA